MKNRERVLQACLEDVETGKLSIEEALVSRDGDAESVARQARVAERFRRAPRTLPSSGFRDGARERLLNLMAESEAQPMESSVRRWNRFPVFHSLRLPVAAALAVALVVGGSYAASAAPPESVLYPARLALEQARLTIVTSEQERLQLRLEIAEQRAAELRLMAQNGSPSDLQAALGRLQVALRSIDRDAIGAPVGDAALVRAEERLAIQEQLTGQVGARDSASAAGLAEATAMIERVRAEIQLRLGPLAADPTATPFAARSQERERLEGAAGVPGATVEPTATAAAVESTPIMAQDRDREQDRDQLGDRDRDQEMNQTRQRLGLDVTSTPVSVGPGPQPSTTPTCCAAGPGPLGTPRQQQRNGPATPTAVPTSTPVATTGGEPSPIPTDTPSAGQQQEQQQQQTREQSQQSGEAAPNPAPGDPSGSGSDGGGSGSGSDSAAGSSGSGSGSDSGGPGGGSSSDSGGSSGGGSGDSGGKR